LFAVGAVAVRLAYLVSFAREYSPRRDADHYQTIASAFANGDGISAPFPFTYVHPTAFRPPLYPAMLGAVYWVTGIHVGVGQLLNVALGATVVVLAAMLGAHIAGYRAGVAAGIAVGVYPPLLANDVVLLSVGRVEQNKGFHVLAAALWQPEQIGQHLVDERPADRRDRVDRIVP